MYMTLSEWIISGRNIQKERMAMAALPIPGHQKRP